MEFKLLSRKFNKNSFSKNLARLNIKNMVDINYLWHQADIMNMGTFEIKSIIEENYFKGYSYTFTLNNNQKINYRHQLTQPYKINFPLVDGESWYVFGAPFPVLDFPNLPGGTYSDAKLNEMLLVATPRGSYFNDIYPLRTIQGIISISYQLGYPIAILGTQRQIDLRDQYYPNTIEFTDFVIKFDKGQLLSLTCRKEEGINIIILTVEPSTNLETSRKLKVLVNTRDDMTQGTCYTPSSIYLNDISPIYYLSHYIEIHRSKNVATFAYFNAENNVEGPLYNLYYGRDGQFINGDTYYQHVIQEIDTILEVILIKSLSILILEYSRYGGEYIKYLKEVIDIFTKNKFTPYIPGIKRIITALTS